MHDLVSCPGCGGLAVAARSSCPHCDRPLARRGGLVRRLALVAGGGAFLMTLAACYGAPRREGNQQGAAPASTTGSGSASGSADTTGSGSASGSATPTTP